LSVKTACQQSRPTFVFFVNFVVKNPCLFVSIPPSPRLWRTGRGYNPLFLALFGGGHQLLLLMQQILAFPVSFVDLDRPFDILRPALFRWNSPFEVKSAIVLN
jgi:hypothetical protein